MPISMISGHKPMYNPIPLFLVTCLDSSYWIERCDFRPNSCQSYPEHPLSKSTSGFLIMDTEKVAALTINLDNPLLLPTLAVWILDNGFSKSGGFHPNPGYIIRLSTSTPTHTFANLLIIPVWLLLSGYG